MKAYVVLVALMSLLISTSAMSWDEYKVKYNKQYKNPAEEAMRHAIYQRNVAKIQSQNSLESSSFKLGINHLTDLKPSEYLKMNGLRLPKKFQGRSSLPMDLILDNSPIPESLDYRQHAGRVSAIKDQGQCGSCWSFATTGLLEGQEYKRANRSSKLVPLSEQELIDCDTVDMGCNGGAMENALDFIKSAGGLERETDYPYRSGTGVDGFSCIFEKSKAVQSTQHVKGYKDLDQGDEELLKKVLAKYGPVAVGIDASHLSFQAYESGIYYDTSCSNQRDELDHAVLVVGYGTCPEHGDYWIIKNSWSERWGEQGYFKLARNKDNHCGVATAATIAVV